MIPALRAGIGLCVLAFSAGAQAATPITFPLGSEFALLGGGDRGIDLPLPPPPPVARPDVSRMSLVIRPRRADGCTGDGPRMRGAQAARARRGSEVRTRA